MGKFQPISARSEDNDMQPNIMDNWLAENAGARFNLGESGVTNLRISDVVGEGDRASEFCSIDFEYNDIMGSAELRVEVAKSYDDASIDRILITAGVSEAILLYFQSSYRPGANIVIPVPTFHTLYDVPSLLGYEVRKVPLRFDRNFSLPLDEIEHATDRNTVAIVINSPNNPTGAVYPDSEIDELIQIARRAGCAIVADEHYRFLPFDETLDHLPSLYGRYPHVVSFGSPSKCLGCAGLRVGWLVADHDVVRKCRELKSMTTFTIFKGSDYLALKIMENRRQLTSQFRESILTNLACFRRFQSEHRSQIAWYEPRAGTIAFPKLLDARMSSVEFAQRLLDSTGVLVLPGESFDMPGFFRIRLGIDPADFSRAVDLLADFMTQKQGRQAWA